MGQWCQRPFQHVSHCCPQTSSWIPSAGVLVWWAIDKNQQSTGKRGCCWQTLVAAVNMVSSGLDDRRHSGTTSCGFSKASYDASFYPQRLIIFISTYLILKSPLQNILPLVLLHCALRCEKNRLTFKWAQEGETITWIRKESVCNEARWGSRVSYKHWTVGPVHLLVFKSTKHTKKPSLFLPPRFTAFKLWAHTFIFWWPALDPSWQSTCHK